MNQAQLSFDDAVDRVSSAQSLVGKEVLAILGGSFKTVRLDAFFDNWSTAMARMPYRIYEYPQKIDFLKAAVPDVENELQRARIFGADGDLSLRRDEQEFHWWFVGCSKNTPVVAQEFGPQDFWKNQPNALFLCHQSEVLLWGTRTARPSEQPDAGQWHDDRVARAYLAYPGDDTWKRVVATVCEYSRAGRLEFVRMTGIEAWEDGAA